MTKFKKVVSAFLISATVVSVAAPCFAKTEFVGTSVNYSFEFGEGVANKNCTVIVYAPNKGFADLETMGEGFKSTVAYKTQIKTNEKGVASGSFKIGSDDAESGIYTLSAAGIDFQEEEKFLFRNSIKTELAADLIEGAKGDTTQIANAVKNNRYDLGVDDKYYSDELLTDASAYISEYLNNTETDFDGETAVVVVNKAIALATLKNGLVTNIIADSEIFDLKNSSVKDFYKKSYVVESVGKDMTERVKKRKNEIVDFDDFDDILTEAFVLSVVNNPNGSDNTKSVMQHFASKIGVTANGTTAQYEVVSDCDFESYEKLKEAFNNAKTTQPKPGGNLGGGSGGGGSYSGGKVSDIIYGEEEEADDFNVYPIKVFDDLDGYSWAEDAILCLAETGVINGTGENKFSPELNVTREEFVKMIVNAFGLKTDKIAENNFEDVDGNAWYGEYIDIAYSLGVISGQSDKIFGIGEKITREDMAVIVKRGAEKAELALVVDESQDIFNDDASISDYAKESVYTLKNSGVISGMGDNRFEPKMFASRAEAAVMIYNIISK